MHHQTHILVYIYKLCGLSINLCKQAKFSDFSAHGDIDFIMKIILSLFATSVLILEAAGFITTAVTVLLPGCLLRRYHIHQSLRK